MQAEQKPNLYNCETIPATTFEPEPLSSLDLEILIDCANHAIEQGIFDDCRYKEAQRARIKAMHHQISAEARERRPS